MLKFLVITTCVLARDVISFKDVEIDSGVVRGYTAEDGDYLAYLGIPYAASPTGIRRFKCPQFGKGDEDCLIVNVFTPTTVSNEPLPVLIYIHGGSFLMGSGQTKGVEPLIKQNIIVVTINYRLGALGFLCLGINEAPGNAGLKDQVAALKWVQRNIREFGGDPNQVTIHGMSAGGASVDLLILSKMSKGLFHKAIIESGVATAVWAVDATPMHTALNFAKAFDFKNNNLYMLIDLYKRLPAKQLSATNNEYYQNLTDGTFGFVPCVEKKLVGIEPFLTESPHQMIKKKAFNKVPMMFIFANLEGLYLRSSDYYELNYKERMEDNFKDFMLADLIFDSDEIRDQITRNIRYFYFGNKTIGDTTLREYLDYFGDSHILHGLLNSVETYAKDNENVYLMEFAHSGKLGSFDQFYVDNNITMAGHGDAIKHVILNKAIEDKSDEVAVDRMANIVANFVKFSTDLLPLHWPAIYPNNVTYLRFDSDLQVLEEPYWDRKIYWDRLYEGYRRDIKAVDIGIL
ncbi:Antennal esterase CXE14 [Operophtera brumata]|uniref:Carboxylic ester hydrolase n=1 Tax=Operophtera brumata TaxID=104452 RepID=A0A0L7KPV6_OPEBR|nr:Antennal esterase CXE14 [Operophtera brumata]